MAEIDSLGVHTPAALDYLVTEGFLPRDPPPGLYKWDTYVFYGSADGVEQELLSTKRCVVWSQGRFVRNVYRFDLEGEDVEQALLTSFPESLPLSLDVLPEQTAEVTTTDHVGGLPRGQIALGTTKVATNMKNDTQHRQASSRALVVLLKTKLHIYFLHGGSHIVDLPFPVNRVFAAPRGVLLERKSDLIPSLSPHSQNPVAPPNSFLSSYLRPDSSYAQSPTLTKSFANEQRQQSGTTASRDSNLTELLHNYFDTPGQADDDDLARLYSLSDPFSTLGVVTTSLQVQKPRFSSKAHPGPSVEFEILDPTERLVYISANSELPSRESDGKGPLTLAVTVNSDLQRLTIWHAWYIDDKTLASLLRARASSREAASLRRSSFPNASIGTGTTTPAPRPRDGGRESFAAGGSIRPNQERAERNKRKSSRKPTQQEEEAAMASQMDPDYVPAGSQQVVRESRRISSLNTDTRGGQNAGAANLTGGVGRRTTSFGGHGDRKSFGHRKSRGSTPGSAFSRSIGLDDDSMDIDSFTDVDEEDAEENIDDILHHIRATMDAAGADSVLGSIDDDFKNELIFRKLHSMSLPVSFAESEDLSAGVRITTLAESGLLQQTEDERLNIYIHYQSTKELISVPVLVRQREIRSHAGQSTHFAIPSVMGMEKLDKCTSLVKLKDNDVEALLLWNSGLIFSIDQKKPCTLPASAPYRMYGLHDFFARYGTQNKDVGKNRMLPAPEGELSLANPGLRSCYDEIGADGVYHRRRMQLRPREDYVHQVIQLCQAMMPNALAREVLPTWCASRSLLQKSAGKSRVAIEKIEWAALVATILAFAVHIVDPKVISALNMRMATARRGQRASEPSAREHGVHDQPAWSWMYRGVMSQTGQTANPDEALKNDMLLIATTTADELHRDRSRLTQGIELLQMSVQDLVRLMVGLHVFREEQKLCISSHIEPDFDLAPVIAQLGTWLGLPAWTHHVGRYYHLEGAKEERWSFVQSTLGAPPENDWMQEPLSVYQWYESALETRSLEPYLSIEALAGSGRSLPFALLRRLEKLTPRIASLSKILWSTKCFDLTAPEIVELAAQHGIDNDMLETMPSGIAAPVREAIARCGSQPPSTWGTKLLELVARDDLDISSTQSSSSRPRLQHLPRDLHTISQGLEGHSQGSKTKEADRHEISQLIFNEDRRLVEATALMHFNTVQVAECVRQPDWTDAVYFEQQRRITSWVTIRMIALPAGDAMIHFDSQTPLLTEKYHLPGFNSSCLVQPMGHTLTADRAGLTEEKVNWAYFNAGVSMGLRISRGVKGIDTSWIAFNKPNDLTNRHAGLLLALGLSGHLRSLAKWLAFKYLTPKHMMTSVGLLLGLSASYMGTMDGLITRMLSVHITRMLPPGAAELNVSPLTQTAGLMGIGLLYYATQHRRMSEIMLSEVENMELEDPDSGPDPLRDESYRLAAGFALGFINLGRGKDLHGLHGMRLPERLLSVAVGPRAVNAVHVFDRATAGAIMAIALVYMKTGDRSIAQKVDIPDTEAQYEHVRPDMLMLRVVAKNLILWDDIRTENNTMNGNARDPKSTWIQANMPQCYRHRFQTMAQNRGRYRLTSADVPLLNIATGLAWVISLKYAGTGDIGARDEILTILSRFAALGADSYYYDAKLARASLRRCIDVLALSAATVMASTGDLQTLRHLRRLHGRTDAETPYGSHLAAHLAMGALFLGGGTYTFGTSNLATASLICAFYPLFPNDVHDNQVHLQAFRHFWVFAAEARCIVVEDIDTLRPVSIPIVMTMKDGSTRGADESGTLRTPCMLPELDSISSVKTNDPSYWHVKLDFVGNPERLAAFRQDQRVYVRRCPASEAHSSAFSAMLAARNATQLLEPAPATAGSPGANSSQSFHSLFSLSALAGIDKPLIELILPPDMKTMRADHRNTVVDDRLALSQAAYSSDRDALWNLRILLAWAERAKEAGAKMKWVDQDFVEALRAVVEERKRCYA